MHLIISNTTRIAYLLFLFVSILHFCCVKSGSSEESLVDIFKSHDQNLAYKLSSYVQLYTDEFLKYRISGRDIHLLEIGVFNGGSLQLWRKYFGPTSVVTGIDINPKVCNMDLGEGISLLCLDATKLESVAYLKVYDIIIDDGSHINEDVINTFTNLFPKVLSGGVYVIEDIETSYQASHGGGLRQPKSTIEFFKLLLDVLSFYVISPENQQVFNTDYVDVIGETNLNYYVRWIHSIKFYGYTRTQYNCRYV